MSNVPNRNNRDPATRMLKTNSFPGKRSDTPDSSASAQRTISPVQNAGPGSPNSPTVAVNHHPIPHVQHHQNHRSYFPRGRCRGDGGYYGGHNHFGGHHSGPNRRTPPSIHGPPFSKVLVDFMMKEWDQFSTHYRSTHAGDPIDNGSMMHSGHQHQQQQPMVPTSPRVGGHVNSPHRGQHMRYSHQNSSGNSWSISNGGNGRKYSENGDHSNTGSLRRHQSHRGGGHASSPLLQSNQPWQRGTLTNRQNSPNNTLNRSTGFPMSYYLSLQSKRRPRHTYRPRPIESSTPPSTSSATAVTTSAATSPVSETTNKVAETAAVPVAEMHSLSLKPSETAAAAAVPNGKKNSEGPTESTSTAPVTLLDVEPKKKTTSSTTAATPRDEAVSSASSSSTSSLTISKVKQQQQQTSGVQQQQQHHHHSTRRRAATTQGSSSVSASATTAALPLSSSLPAARASETASVASSSFCSLVDQVDAMSAADQYFTPEPPSPSSSASASLSVVVSESFQNSAAITAVKSAESPPLPSPPPLASAPVSSSAATNR